MMLPFRSCFSLRSQMGVKFVLRKANMKNWEEIEFN